MQLPLTRGFAVTDFAPADQAALVEHLQEKQIYDQTLNIPYPYTAADADWWLAHVATEAAQQGESINWAIRDPNGRLVGGIGFHGLEVGVSHRAELGYWLAKPYWGQGLMTEAATQVTAHAFARFGLARVTGHVFATNQGSARVLEKAGFQLEGHLRNFYRKDGRIFDGKLYAKTP